MALTRRPVGLADPQIVADGGQQQLKSFGTGLDLGRRPAVARELRGQLVIVDEKQIVQGSGQV
jgi:hypothetical protein